MSTASVIDFRDVSHSYGAKRALDRVSWSLAPGRICALLGRNGAGKTTTINILNSFLEPEAGSCHLLGEDARALGPATKARIGYLMEGHVLYGFMDTAQLERFHSAFYPRWDGAIYRHLVSKLDIHPRQPASTMSCGQRSQVALGLVLAQRPDLIILDDFSMGLDPGYRRLFVETLREYAVDGRRSILLTSHIIQDLEGLADDILVYQKGRLLLDMPAAELLRTHRHYQFTAPASGLPHEGFDERTMERLECGPRGGSLSGFLDEDKARARLAALGVDPTTIAPRPANLEDIFISLTGKY